MGLFWEVPQTRGAALAVRIPHRSGTRVFTSVQEAFRSTGDMECAVGLQCSGRGEQQWSSWKGKMECCGRGMHFSARASLHRGVLLTNVTSGGVPSAFLGKPQPVLGAT